MMLQLLLPCKRLCSWEMPTLSTSTRVVTVATVATVAGFTVTIGLGQCSMKANPIMLLGDHHSPLLFDLDKQAKTGRLKYG